MKNTLAENLLRFGVKNLSESDIKKLQEQTPTTTPPATPPAQAAQPNAATPATTNPLEELGKKWADKQVANNIFIGEYNKDKTFVASGEFVEFTTRFPKDLMTTYKQKISSARYKYNPTKNVSINSAGREEPGVLPYTWTLYDDTLKTKEWSNYDYGTPIEQMEIPKNSPFLKDLKFYFNQTATKPSQPAAAAPK